MTEIEHGRLLGARWCPSPNFDSRPESTQVDTLVLHCIALPPKTYGACNKHGERYIDLFFSNRLNGKEHDYFKSIEHMKVSAHLFIDRDGAITQYVNFNDRAWHAGQSSFKGCANCNDYSIGIELEGCDEDRYTDPQYRSLSQTIRSIRAAHPGITKDRIVGHEHIAPGRKTDPGQYFDWVKLEQLLDSSQQAES